MDSSLFLRETKKFCLHSLEICGIIIVEVEGLLWRKERVTMFAVGDLVVYGGEGVCRVESIGPAAVPGADKNRLYYTLVPLYRTGQVLTPVDTRVLMRPILPEQEARALVESLPTLTPEETLPGNVRLLKDYYQAIVTGYDCAAMARLLHTLDNRRRKAAKQGKKPSQMDERYAKRAEDQLFGELGAALGLPRESVRGYIRQRHPNWPEI